MAMASSWWFNIPCLWKIIWGYHSWPPAFHGEVHYFALTSLTSWMRSVPLETSMPRVNALTFAIGCRRALIHIIVTYFAHICIYIYIQIEIDTYITIWIITASQDGTVTTTILLWIITGCACFGIEGRGGLDHEAQTSRRCHDSPSL